MASIITNLSLGGSGGGGINYITNPGAETNATGLASYNNVANAGTGAGGSPTATLARSTTSPLRGIGSFLYTSGGAGDGVSAAFTIDPADKAKMLSVSFDYAIASGTFADGALQVWIYDVTNAVLTQPAPYLIQNSTVNNKFSTVFQTASNSTSYKLLIWQPSAGTFTFAFDNVQVGPQPIIRGAPVGDWRNDLTFIPSAGYGTVSNSSIWYRRVGDTLQVRGSFNAGTVSATIGSIGLPTSLAIDSAKLQSVANHQSVGYFNTSSAGSNQIYGVNISGTAFYDGSTTAGIYFANTTASNQLTKDPVNNYMGSGQMVTFEFSVPIAGWSSSVLMSNDADTRVVALTVTSCAALTLTASDQIIKYLTIDKDTHGSYSPSTGNYTCTVSGFYKVRAQYLVTETLTTSQQTRLNLYKNGSVATNYFLGGISGSGIDVIISNTFTIYCLAGDTLSVYAASSGSGSLAVYANGGYTNLSIERLSGPSAIAASESINLRVNTNAAPAITTGQTAVITFPNVEYDSHSQFVTNTVTIPSPGRYRYTVKLTAAAPGTAWAVGNQFNVGLNKNGSEIDRAINPQTAAHSQRVSTLLQETQRFVAGDTLQVTCFNGNAGTINLLGVSTYDNVFTLERVGN